MTTVHYAHQYLIRIHLIQNLYRILSYLVLVGCLAWLVVPTRRSSGSVARYGFLLRLVLNSAGLIFSLSRTLFSPLSILSLTRPLGFAVCRFSCEKFGIFSGKGGVYLQLFICLLPNGFDLCCKTSVRQGNSLLGSLCTPMR